MSDVPRDPNEYQAPPPVPGGVEGLSSEVRNWGMLCHLSGLLGYFLIPLGNVIAPLIVWLIKKDDNAWLNEQGKEALNFQISTLIYFLIGVATWCFGIGIAIVFAVWIGGLVLSILAAVKASNGESYRYPLTIRLVN